MRVVEQNYRQVVLLPKRVWQGMAARRHVPEKMIYQLNLSRHENETNPLSGGSNGWWRC